MRMRFLSLTRRHSHGLGRGFAAMALSLTRRHSHAIGRASRLPSGGWLRGFATGALPLCAREGLRRLSLSPEGTPGTPTG